MSGEIVADGELAEAIVAQGKAGADWQLSIGAEVEAAELVQEGKRKVNGVEHEAPFYHVTKSTLREVSVVAVGADRSTHMSVTAKLELKGNSIMEPEVTNKETKPVAAAAPANPPAATASNTINAVYSRTATIAYNANGISCFARLIVQLQGKDIRKGYGHTCILQFLIGA